MDGIAAINGRIAEIQGRIATLAPARPTTTNAAAATSALRAPGAGAGTADSFASVLAAQLDAATAGSSTSASARVSGVGSYGQAQVANAAAIMAAGAAMGLSERDQTIGVMTAIGESSLRALDYGDTAGPDSRGLFQQRDNGAWGSLAERMDPTASATNFFTALQKIPGRDAMSPTAVAHQVQRNADPQHYAKYWDDAVAIVSRLNGTA